MEEFTELLRTFTKIEEEIKNRITTNSDQQKESEILDAYNALILYSYPVWQSTDKKLKEKIKATLVDIHHRLKDSLDILKSDVKLPTCLTTKIKVKVNLEDTNKNFTNMNTMEDLKEFRERIRQLESRLQISEDRNKIYEEQIKSMEKEIPIVHEFKGIDIKEEKPIVDVETIIPTGDDIQLDVFKCLPEFSGIPGTYHNWRNQALRAMKPIQKFVGHPKYGAALGIIRAKIVGPASDTLINTATRYNFSAFIKTLDDAYMDLRPMYAIEAEMTSIVQGPKTLREFYTAIDQALNILITRILQTYPTNDAVKAMTSEAQQKAVRTFIMGLRSSYTRQILYGRIPETLAQALAIAQTVYYDSDQMRLEKMNQQQQGRNTERNGNNKFLFRQENNAYINKQQPVNVNKQYRPAIQEVQEYRPTNNNYQQRNMQPNGQQKHEYNAVKKNIKPFNGTQRINQLHDGELDPTNEDVGEDIIPDDLVSNSSNDSTTSSAFLEE